MNYKVVHPKPYLVFPSVSATVIKDVIYTKNLCFASPFYNIKLTCSLAKINGSFPIEFP